MLTHEVVSHDPRAGCSLRPVNRAPRRGPSSTQLAPLNSGEKRPARFTSVTSSHTRSIDASTRTSTRVHGPSAYLTALFPALILPALLFPALTEAARSL